VTSSPAPAGGPLGIRHKRVQRVRRLLAQPSFRRAERAFVVEGVKVVAEALRAGASVEGLYVAAEGGDDCGVQDLVGHAQARGIRVFRLGPGVMERAADTVTPQPVLAVAAALDGALSAVRDAPLAVVCVDVRDPGNLGTVLRSAEASGAGAVICCEGTVDVYNPKCVRASAGSVFHVRLVAGGDPVEVLEQVGAWGVRRLGSSSTRGTPYDEADLCTPAVLVLGNEAHGLSGEPARLVDEWVTIPMAGRAESLNVSMAAAVLCFEAARQRRVAAAGGRLPSAR
jgi:TrmH family RNA methyltransferase